MILMSVVRSSDGCDGMFQSGTGEQQLWQVARRACTDHRKHRAEAIDRGFSKVRGGVVKYQRSSDPQQPEVSFLHGKMYLD